MLLIKPNFAFKGGPEAGIVQWLKPLLDVDKVLESEQRSPGEALAHDPGLRDRFRRPAKLVVTIEARAEGDYTHDWLKNKSIDNFRPPPGLYV